MNIKRSTRTPAFNSDQFRRRFQAFYLESSPLLFVERAWLRERVATSWHCEQLCWRHPGHLRSLRRSPSGDARRAERLGASIRPGVSPRWLCERAWAGRALEAALVGCDVWAAPHLASPAQKHTRPHHPSHLVRHTRAKQRTFTRTMANASTNTHRPQEGARKVMWRTAEDGRKLAARQAERCGRCGKQSREGQRCRR